MNITNDLILKLEKLGRLELSAEERIEIKKNLEDILEMINKMQDVNTEGVEPLVYVNPNHSPPREDKVAKELTQDEALENVPEHELGYIKVPKVLNINN